MKYFLYCLCVLTLSFASNADIAELKERLAQQHNSIKSYQAQVINTLEGAALKTKTLQKGQVYFQGPQLVRTDTFEPAQQIILNKNGKSWLIDRYGDAQEIIPEKNLLNIKDPLELLDKFDFQVMEIENNILKIVGRPKSTDPQNPFSTKYLSKAFCYLDNTSNLLKEIKVYNSKNQEFAKIVIEYCLIDNINFPFSIEITLRIQNNLLRIKTIYQAIKLNQEIPQAIFDLEKIKQQAKGLPNV